MLRDVMEIAPAAVAAGVARQLVGDQVNPSFRNLPVARQAWWLDAGEIAAGLLMSYFGQQQRMPAVSAAGKVFTTTGVAHTARDATQELRRRFQGTTAAAAAPTQILQSRARVAAANIPPMQYVGSEY